MIACGGAHPPPLHVAMSAVRKVAVIGGGAAGLATARRMKAAFEVVVFEAADRPGGTWLYSDDECGGAAAAAETRGPLARHSSMYRDLRQVHAWYP